MAEIKIPRSYFLTAYNQSLGIEGALKLIKDVIAEAGLTEREEYSKEEALKICEMLSKRPGFVKIIACSLSARIYLQS